MDTAADTIKAGLVIPGDVIVVEGVKYEVLAGHTTPKTRTLRLRSTCEAGIERTIRPRRETLLVLYQARRTCRPVQ